MKTKEKIKREDRLEARHKILKAANKSIGTRGDRFTMRTIQRAVFKVRQWKLVSDKVLVEAGYNPR